VDLSLQEAARREFVPCVQQRLMHARWVSRSPFCLCFALIAYWRSTPRDWFKALFWSHRGVRWSRAASVEREESWIQGAAHLSRTPNASILSPLSARQIPSSRHGRQACFSIRRYRRFHQPTTTQTSRCKSDRRPPPSTSRRMQVPLLMLRSFARRNLQRDRGWHSSQSQTAISTVW